MDESNNVPNQRAPGVSSEQKNSCTSSFIDGFSSQSRSEELEIERIKRQNYHRDLGLQIEEKRRLVAMREEQENKEQELENRGQEEHMYRMQEEEKRCEVLDFKKKKSTLNQNHY